MITLKTLAKATPQEVFDQVARHLLTQMEKSTDESGKACRYHGLRELACAAGCLIADSEYHPEMDDSDNYDTSWAELIKVGLIPSTAHDKMISALQAIHDETPVHQWKSRLKDHAEYWNLEWRF